MYILLHEISICAYMGLKKAFRHQKWAKRRKGSETLVYRELEAREPITPWKLIENATVHLGWIKF